MGLCSAVTMVMKSSVDEDEAGWGLGIPEKMKNNANWVDITQDFRGACKGKDWPLVFSVKVQTHCSVQCKGKEWL